MISNQILTDTVTKLKELTSFDMSVSDVNGAVLAGTYSPNQERILEKEEFLSSGHDFLEGENVCFVKGKRSQGDDLFILTIEGEGSDIEKVAQLTTFQLSQLFEAYDSRTLVNDFYSNLFCGNILDTNLKSEAGAVGIETDIARGIFLIGTVLGSEVQVSEDIKALLKDNGSMVTISVERGVVILIADFLNLTRSVKADLQNSEKKEASDIPEDDILHAAAVQIRDNYSGAEFIRRISYGPVAYGIDDVNESYQKARTALKVFEMFAPNEFVVSYLRLGLGGLIYGLPEKSCEDFLSEHFDVRTLERIDKEILHTVNAFFDNSLNISETARQLFIHRNTLIYRLKKLLKLTGLDVRNLDDAITFKLSVMVHRRFSESGAV